MADDNKIEVEIVLNDGSIQRGFINMENQAKNTFSRIGEFAAGALAADAIAAGLSKVKDILVGTFTDAVNSASEYSLELQKLNGSLALSGRYSEGASQQFQKMADDIQKTTGYSDDQVLSVATLASTFSHSNDQAKKLTQATLDFAAATGKDANEAASQLAITLQGNIGRLGRYFPALKELTQSQLEAGAAVDYLAQRFKGAAESQSNTYAVAVKQTSHAYDDLLKSIGQFITESPTVIASIKFVAKELLSLADMITDFRGSEDFFSNFAAVMIGIGEGINKGLVFPFEVFVNSINAGTSLITLAFAGIGTAVVAVAEGLLALGPIANTVVEGLFNVLTRKISASQFAEQLATKFSESFELTRKGLEAIGKGAEYTNKAFTTLATNTPISDGIADTLDRYNEALDEAAKKTTEFTNQTPGDLSVMAANIRPIFQDYEEQVNSLGRSFELFSEGFFAEANKIEDTAKKTFQQGGANAIRGFANATAAGFSQIGKALVTGQDLLQAFAGAFLGAIGTALIAEGGARILQGIARAFGSYGLDPTATGLIATGSAMTVAGGALQAIGGGGVTGVSNPSTSIATGGGSAVDTGSAGSSDGVGGIAAETKAPGITVNIQGDVLDSNETGLRIVQIINDQFNSTGARIVAS